MSTPQDQDRQPSNDPLHGVTLQAMLEDLVGRHDWPWLAERISIRCFRSNPTMGSSLAFLRRTPWARTKVEKLYVSEQRRRKRNARRKWRKEAKRAHDAAAGQGERSNADDADPSSA